MELKESRFLFPSIPLSFLMAPKHRLDIGKNWAGTTALVALYTGEGFGLGVQMLLTWGHSSQGSKL